MDSEKRCPGLDKISKCSIQDSASAINRSSHAKVIDETKIFDAVLDLLVSHGYEGATTQKIAEIAGVNKVTLFRYVSRGSRPTPNSDRILALAGELYRLEHLSARLPAQRRAR